VGIEHCALCGQQGVCVHYRSLWPEAGTVPHTARYLLVYYAAHLMCYMCPRGSPTKASRSGRYWILDGQHWPYGPAEHQTIYSAIQEHHNQHRTRCIIYCSLWFTAASALLCCTSHCPVFLWGVLVAVQRLAYVRVNPGPLPRGRERASVRTACSCCYLYCCCSRWVRWGWVGSKWTAQGMSGPDCRD